MTASSYRPLYRVVTKAIVDPCGFQAGPASCAGSLVRRTNPVPFALMTQMSLFPLTTEHVKASLVPSGDQVGFETDCGLSVMSVGAEPPAAYATLIVGLSCTARPRWNAIFSTCTQVTAKAVRAVSLVVPPVVTCTVRGLSPAIVQFVAAPKSMTV